MGIKSQNMLSTQEILYLKSQYKSDVKLNKSELRSRIKEKVEESFNGFDTIIDSKEIDLEYLNILFPSDKIKKILSRFCTIDKDVSPNVEKNKLAITHDMLHLAFKFYEARFEETKFLKSKMQELDTLIYELNKLSNEKREKAQNIRMYETRGRWKCPPKIELDEFWHAVCMICWHYSYGKTKSESIKKIEHHEFCKFNECDIEVCVKTYPPK